MRATKQIILDFCTPMLGAPGASHGCQPSRGCQPPRGRQPDVSLAAAIMSKIEVVDTDAAADEVAAARQLKITEAFPNVKLLLKDPTHACTRRCLLRWDGCPGTGRE